MDWPLLILAPGALLFVMAILIGNAEAAAILAGWPSLLQYGPTLVHIHVDRRVMPMVAIGSVVKNGRVMVMRVNDSHAFFRSRFTFSRHVQYTGEITWDATGADATARWFLGSLLGIVGFSLLLLGACSLAFSQGNTSGGFGALGISLCIALGIGLQLKSSRRQFQQDWPMILPLLEGSRQTMELPDA